MNDLKQDMSLMQTHISSAFALTGRLVAMSDGEQSDPQKLQRELEKTMAEFEETTLTLRNLCERYSTGAGGYGRRQPLPRREVTGRVDMLGHSWLHIKLNMLLPHCRYQTPVWLSDTIRLLLDGYEVSGGQMPYYRDRAVLVIDEHSDVDGRSIYDQDNKGWKAVSNTLKGRVFPDDNQYSLGVILLSTKSGENVTHITVMDAVDAGDFLSLHSGYCAKNDVYDRL